MASAEWAGLIVADSPEKLFVHGPEGELLELKLDAEPEAPEADAGPSPPSAGSLSDEPSAHLSAADAPAVPLPPRGAFVYLQDSEQRRVRRAARADRPGAQRRRRARRLRRVRAGHRLL